MKIVPFPLKKSSNKGWKDVFSNPRPVTVESFKTGTVTLNMRGTLNPKHLNAGHIEDEDLEVPIMAHLVHHDDFGDYLLDTGLDASYCNDPRGNVRGIFSWIFTDEFQQEKDENIAYHLNKRGIKLEGVFLSHLHSDHMAGIRELPHDIQYVIGKGEKCLESKPFHYGGYFKGLEAIHEIDFSTVETMPPLGPSADLLGDGSLWAIHTPGHTKGHMSFLVNGLGGPLLLTIDACFIRENLERSVAPSSYTWNVERAQKSLDNILEFLREYPQVRVICGHEKP
ncbi:MBL fold metallo-hydrolase [Methanobacterium aggregans]|uniref:MBL fold metallo-hydrolase n=1 Tax=Methanobacterium aggregans TaxID=1615586 RepID=UPI001AE30F5C|nr:MBL fold metallo-hydrolase [Methanobacterium aggregans]MBP2046649.1 glyoxylase-like metal-dependent hydrolase (beta-lactamase superfamily II) [Methanobacterium aggregans]